MCGIVGYITLDNDTRTLSKDKFLREAIYTDTLRGNDSTGLMTLTDEFRWAWCKQAVPGWKFIREKSFFEREVKTWCAVGHNRAATVGKVTTDNAHPFSQGPIILVHNGTLRSTYQLPHVNHKLIVDSDLLAYNLAEEEPEDAHKVLGKIQGAYALVWFDSRDESVNIARNSERPLHMGISTTEDMLMFASDGHMLSFISSRISDTSCHLKENIWEIGTLRLLKYKKGSLIPEVTKVVPFIPPAAVCMGMGYPQATPTTGTTGVNRSGRSVGDIPRPGGRQAEVGRTLIAGICRKIPEAHSTMIEDWYHLKHDVNLMFIPQAFQPWGTSGKGAVYGKIWHSNWQTYFDAVVTEATCHTMQMYKGSSWTVHAVGVDHTRPTDPRGGCTFICKTKLYKWEGTFPSKPLIEKEEENEIIEPISPTLIDVHGNEIKIANDDNEYVKGPHGDITIEAWWKLCQSGCTMCGGPLFIADHEETTWVGEMSNQPLCLDCLDEATKFTQIPADMWNRDRDEEPLTSGWDCTHDH